MATRQSTRQAIATASAAATTDDDAFEEAVVGHDQANSAAHYESAGGIVDRRKDGGAYAYTEQWTVDGRPRNVIIEFPVETPGDRESELEAAKAALLASPPGRRAARRALALSALRERARNGRVPDREEKMRRLQDALKTYVEQGEAGIAPAIVKRLKKLKFEGFSRKIREAVPRHVFDQIQEKAEEIAAVLASPGPDGQYLYVGHEDYKEEIDAIRATFTSLTHRNWTGGMLKEVRKTGMDGENSLYKRMVRKAFGSRLPHDVLDALVELRLFETDHLNAEVTDDPLNFVLMFASANGMFGRATNRQLKKKFVGTVAWEGARAFVVEATSLSL